MRLIVEIALGIAFGIALTPAVAGLVNFTARLPPRLHAAMPHDARARLARALLLAVLLAVLVGWYARDRAAHFAERPLYDAR